MVTWARRITYSTVAGLIVVAAILAGSLIVNAQADDAFPGITSGSDWKFNANSPDPNLTWLYNSGGTVNGQTTHILRNRSLGRNIGTTLRVYFNHRPNQVSVTLNVVDCQLDAPNQYAGRLIVDLGGQRLYDQDTLAPNKYGHYYIKKAYVNAHEDRTTIQQNFAGNGGQFGNSPVCNNYGAYNVDDWIDREGCNNYDPAPNQTHCTGVGNNTYTLDKTGNGTHTVPGTNTKLDGRTFTVSFPPSGNGNGSLGRDPTTGLYFADLDITLTANDDTNVPPAVMQRISFRVKANDAINVENGNSMNAKMGYRFSAPESDGSKYFGLQGNGGGANDYPSYGQKFAVPFGTDCSETVDKPGKVVIYDPDVSGYGDSYAMIFRRDPTDKSVTQVGASGFDFSAGKYSNVEWNGGTKRFKLTAGSNQNSFFTLSEVKVGFQYMMVIVNPKSTPAPPSTNVWSVKLPSDSINGLINCRFSLVPHLDNVKSDFTTYGDTLAPHGWIENTEDTTTAVADHNWRITRAVFASKPADLARVSPTNSNDGESPCDFMSRKSGAYVSCNSIHNGTYPADDDESVPQSVGPYGLGTYVCYMTSVKDPTWETNDNDKWANSVMQCSVASAKPKVQTWSYDLKAGGQINTSLSSFNGNTYGSWGEYGIMSNLRNYQMGSGNGLMGGVPNGFGQDSWSPLTFASGASQGGVFGNFGGVTAPIVSQDGAINGPAVIGSLAGLNKRQVYRINGTLRISGNLDYNIFGSFNNIEDLPRVVLVADDIIIDPGVTSIDPWLVAVGNGATPGRISTCSQVAGWSMQTANLYGAQNGVGGICTNQLTFNGPVVTDKIYLYRTFDNQGGDAAEIFNLRPDAFLSSAAGGGTTKPVATTDIVTELPPRF